MRVDFCTIGKGLIPFEDDFIAVLGSKGELLGVENFGGDVFVPLSNLYIVERETESVPSAEPNGCNGGCNWFRPPKGLPDRMLVCTNCKTRWIKAKLVDKGLYVTREEACQK